MKNKEFQKGILILPVVINTVIFVLLSGIHLYWGFGGKHWHHEVLPTSSNGVNRLNPGALACFAVAFALLVFAFITIGNQGIFNRYIKKMYFRSGALIIAVLFLLRAIGDFKFVGFFKTVKLTRFAVNDTQLFSPLCLFISILSTLIFILTRSK
jgi:hypothetical protein